LAAYKNDKNVKVILMKEVSAGIIIYRKTEEGPKFLLLYHGSRYWNFAKGKIEVLNKSESGGPEIKETSLRAALRETAEETGLKAAELKLKSRFKVYERYTFFRDKKRIFKMVVFYLAETKERQIKISDEHDGFGWFEYEEAKRLLRHKDSIALLKKAEDFITWSPRKQSS